MVLGRADIMCIDSCLIIKPLAVNRNSKGAQPASGYFYFLYNLKSFIYGIEAVYLGSGLN